MIRTVANAMAEQAAAVAQTTTAAEDMRRQSEQAARALAEQSRTMKNISVAAASTSRQIHSITVANKEHAAGAKRLAERLKEVRDITDRNARGVKDTRGGTEDLLRQAAALTSALEVHAEGTRGQNGTYGRG
jgi:methyl-accepting chemotaxis protein